MRVDNIPARTSILHCADRDTNVDSQETLSLDSHPVLALVNAVLHLNCAGGCRGLSGCGCIRRPPEPPVCLSSTDIVASTNLTSTPWCTRAWLTHLPMLTSS